MNLLIDAMRHVGRGMHIFPVEPNAKTPIRIYQDKPKEEAPWTVKWSEIATDDPNKVIEWWTWCPSANIGVACAPSNILVVDADVAKRDGNLKGTPWEHLHSIIGPAVDGDYVYDQIAQELGGGLDAVTEAYDTYTVATGSGGRHFYYRWPEGITATQASIVRGVLDIRCNGGERGGYVLGAGSATSSGLYVPELARDIRDAPPWLVELCRDRPPVAQPLGRGADVIVQPRSVNFGGLVDSVRLAQEGNRNNALLWAARAMCGDGATEAEALELLEPAARQAGLHERDIHATIKSAYRLQTAKGVR